MECHSLWKQSWKRKPTLKRWNGTFFRGKVTFTWYGTPGLSSFWTPGGYMIQGLLPPPKSVPFCSCSPASPPLPCTQQNSSTAPLPASWLCTLPKQPTCSLQNGQPGSLLFWAHSTCPSPALCIDSMDSLAPSCGTALPSRATVGQGSSETLTVVGAIAMGIIAARQEVTGYKWVTSWTTLPYRLTNMVNTCFYL